MLTFYWIGWIGVTWNDKAQLRSVARGLIACEKRRATVSVVVVVKEVNVATLSHE